MPEPDYTTIVIAIKREGEEWGATAMSTTVGQPAARGDADDENPYEAAWNALAKAMQKAGFDV